MKSLAAALIIVLGLFVTESQAQALWQKATYGMSVAAAKKAFPNAIIPPKADSLANSAVEKLRIPDIEISGHKFDAKFYFLGDKLDQVTLEATDRKPFDQMTSRFQQLREVLAAKYGSELSRQSQSGPLIYSLESTWLAGRTNITLFLMGLGENPAVFSVIYQVRVTKEADKL